MTNPKEDEEHENQLKDLIKELALVCKCQAVKYRTIKHAIQKKDAKSLEEIRRLTRANTGCGKQCTEKIIEMIKKYRKEHPEEN